MNKKGFTLIELLAVIIILGVIMLIAIPSVSSVIKNSKEKTTITNAKTYLNEISKYKILSEMNPDTYSELEKNNAGSYDVSTINSKIKMTGQMPSSGTVSLDAKGNVTAADLTYSNYQVNYNNNEYEYSSSKKTVWEYSSTNNIKSLTLPYNGKYKLEVWGAQGGRAANYPGIFKDNYDYTGGYGGYSVGYINVITPAEIFIVVGSQGKEIEGGYNGGGDGYNWNDNGASGGGGATHIALSSGLLSTLKDSTENILIVAGGGGGAGWACNAGDTTCTSYSIGGSGGGTNATAGIDMYNLGKTDATWYFGIGATQTAAGATGSFGKGGDATGTQYGGSGGGGGFYGGGRSTRCHAGGGGGSGYIGNSHLNDAEMYCYNCTYSLDKKTTNTSENPTAGYAKVGDGYAKITYIEN